MNEFSFHRPQAVDEAVAIYGGSDEPRFLAGGQTLIPVLKQRLAAPSDLVALSEIPELKSVSADATGVTIGAMCTHADVAGSHDVQQALPVIAKLAAGIGDPHVRNRGTIGGSLANNDPAADYPAAALGLGATIQTNRREIASDEFFQGMFATALEDGEMITAIRFPKPDGGAYEKFRHPASRYAIVGVFVARTAEGSRVAVTGAGQDGVFRVTQMETALNGNFAPDALNGLSVPADELNTDIHAAADYRAHLISVLAKRAVAKVLEGH